MSAKLFARIRKLTDRIVDLQAKFDLPKGHKDRFETYGGAQSLQAARVERQGLQGNLDPIRLIATGVSCRDCLHFIPASPAYSDPFCEGAGTTTGEARQDERPWACGPEAKRFQALAAHA